MSVKLTIKFGLYRGGGVPRHLKTGDLRAVQLAGTGIKGCVNDAKQTSPPTHFSSPPENQPIPTMYALKAITLLGMISLGFALPLGHSDDTLLAREGASLSSLFEGARVLNPLLADVAQLHARQAGGSWGGSGLTYSMIPYPGY
jgi:hypothetical protein